jgi:redox-sensitive bicupin YhaK (pirin superfamily)
MTSNPARSNLQPPHSGLATLTYVAEGSVRYIDPDNVRGTRTLRRFSDGPWG